MEELSGRKRISAAFKQTFTGKKPALDRIPAYQFAGHCNAQLVGASIKEFLTKPDVFVKAQLAGYDLVIFLAGLSNDPMAEFSLKSFSAQFKDYSFERRFLHSHITFKF